MLLEHCQRIPQKDKRKETAVSANKTTKYYITGKHSNYQRYSDSNKLKFTKYFILHGSQKVARKSQNHFSKLNESIVQIFINN